MPDSPHLEWSWCGYTLLDLSGLSPETLADEVIEVTVNGMEQKFRPWRHRILMIVPQFKQEAQIVNVHCREMALKPVKPVQARVAPPEAVYGFTPPDRPYEGAPR